LFVIGYSPHEVRARLRHRPHPRLPSTTTAALHSPHIDVTHDLDAVPWPWSDASCDEILGLDVFEHLHLMPEAWLRECHRMLCPGRLLRLRVPSSAAPGT
jgi:predicted SAM-dependent methyltransferase